MDSEVEVPVFALYLVWMCLTLTPPKLNNPAFAMVLSTMDVLEHLVIASLVVFAPGLLEVMHTSAPPTTTWFKRLPSQPFGL